MSLPNGQTNQAIHLKSWKRKYRHSSLPRSDASEERRNPDTGPVGRDAKPDWEDKKPKGSIGAGGVPHVPKKAKC